MRLIVSRFAIAFFYISPFGRSAGFPSFLPTVRKQLIIAVTAVMRLESWNHAVVVAPGMCRIAKIRLMSYFQGRAAGVSMHQCLPLGFID